jgi:predicted  nucleic acid-binding Zn-ribbon protein
MPHQCTNCGRAFSDGSKEMLSGCPDCGGNKFQFRPEGTVEGGDARQSPDDARTPTDADASQSAGGDAPDAAGSDPGAAARAGAAVRDWVGLGGDDADERTDDDIIVADETPADADTEDRAQASARGDVVSEDELTAMADEDAAATSDADEGDASADRGESPPAERADVDAEETPPDAASAGDAAAARDDAADRPGLDELREELNQQFESIRIVSPGQYELNLMELYDREEYIISLQEDGRYVIEVPDRWGDGATDEE